MNSLLYLMNGNRRYALPVSVVLKIFPRIPAYKLPFALSGVQYIVPLGEMLAPVVDLYHETCNGMESDGYYLLVKTKNGPILISVDRLSASEFPSTNAHLLVQNDLDALVSDFAPVEPVREGTACPFEAAHPHAHIIFLIAEAGDTPVAIPATAVVRVDRHHGSKATRNADTYERLVTVGETLMAGFSLSHWLYRTAGRDAEPWALIIDNGTRQFAVTVTRVHGLVEANRRAIQSVTNRHGTMLWYLDPSQGPMEIIEPAAFDGDPKPEERPISLLQLGPSDIGVAPDRASERRRGLQVKRGIAARVGSYYCVFPVTATLAVIGCVDRTDLGARQPNTYPVLDLASFLDVSPHEKKQRAIVLTRRNRRTLLVLVDDVITVSDENIWQPLPTLPPPFHDLFQAIGYDGNRLYFLVKEDALNKRLNDTITMLVKRSLLGYVAGDYLFDTTLIKL